jgi:putative transposase
MPRKPRFNLVGIPQHVIQRGNNREPCFYAEEDYRRYLTDLEESASKFDCHIHAYVQMTNHYLCGAPHKACTGSRVFRKEPGIVKIIA